MDKSKIIIIILALALIIAAGYIITTKVDICETAKNDSYYAGYNQGVERWNAQVIYSVNNNKVIPYWFNNSYYELNIAQMCS